MDQKRKNVRFCPVNQTFLGSFYLYVNVLEQAQGAVNIQLLGGSGW